MADIFFGTIIKDGLLSAEALIALSLCALLAGVILAALYRLLGETNRSFLLTLAILPVVVQLVIVLINGNLGTGVAVAGAFSLVRFRSAAGSGREITGIFLAMAVGLAVGMGYLGVAVIAALTVPLFTL